MVTEPYVSLAMKAPSRESERLPLQNSTRRSGVKPAAEAATIRCSYRQRRKMMVLHMIWLKKRGFSSPPPSTMRIFIGLSGGDGGGGDGLGAVCHSRYCSTCHSKSRAC